MAKKKYIVTLTEDEQKILLNIISTGRRKAKTITHAQILLRADRGSSGILQNFLVKHSIAYMKSILELPVLLQTRMKS